MNILFYVEPLVERDNPLWKKGWLLDFMHRMVSSLSTADTQAHEFACITGSASGRRRARSWARAASQR